MEVRQSRHAEIPPLQTRYKRRTNRKHSEERETHACRMKSHKHRIRPCSLGGKGDDGDPIGGISKSCIVLPERERSAPVVAQDLFFVESR